jgi:hypothetical protein
VPPYLSRNGRLNAPVRLRCHVQPQNYLEARPMVGRNLLLRQSDEIWREIPLLQRLGAGRETRAPAVLRHTDQPQWCLATMAQVLVSTRLA